MGYRFGAGILLWMRRDRGMPLQKKGSAGAFLGVLFLDFSIDDLDGGTFLNPPAFTLGFCENIFLASIICNEDYLAASLAFDGVSYDNIT